jgi:hypothetical protein
VDSGGALIDLVSNGDEEDEPMYNYVALLPQIEDGMDGVAADGIATIVLNMTVCV